MAEDLEGLLAGLLEGDLPAVLVADGRAWRTDVVRHRVVVPGSFDPVHEGHLALADAAGSAAAAAGHTTAGHVFELAVRNVDKPPLDVGEVLRRVGPLRVHGPVLVTAAPRFDEKAALLRDAVLAVGHDTAVRLLDPAYHGGRVAARDAALATLAAAGCVVAVAGRAVADGPYRDLDDLDVPDAHRELFLPVPGFRVDVSSSALRGDR